MAAKTIETRAIISAQDKTGETFAQVAKKLAQLETTSRQVAARTSAAMRAPVQAIERQAADISRRQQVGKGLQVARAAASAVAANQTARRIIEQGGSQQHEAVRMAAGGMSPSEIKEAQELSARLGKTYKGVSETQIMHMLRNTRAIVGTFEEATHVIDPLLKLRQVARGANAHGSPEELEGDFDKLIKGLELKGVTQNLPEFTRYLDGMAKALNTFGDTLRPSAYFEMFKYGKASTQHLSERYTTSVAPTLAQELGGSSAGDAQSSLYNAIVGGKMKMSAAKSLIDIGMIDEKNVIKTKTGSIKGTKPGAVKGWRKFMTDPDKWIYEDYLPALRKKGITDPLEQAAHFSSDFSNTNAANLVRIIATQQARIEKDAALSAGAKGLDADYSKSFVMATERVKLQIDNLEAAAARPFMENLTAGMNKFADVVSRVSDMLNHDPALAVTGTLGTLGASAIGAGTGVGLTAAMFGYGSAGAALTAGALAFGGGAALLGAGYLFGRGEVESANARDRLLSDPRYTPQTPAEVAEAQRARREVQRQIFENSMRGGFADPLLAAQDADLNDRINRGARALWGARPGGAGEFGFGALGVGAGMGGGGGPGTAGFQPIIDSAVLSAMQSAHVQLDPASKATIDVRIKVDGPGQVVSANAKSSGNLDVNVGSGPGSVGKTSVGGGEE